MQMDGSMNLKGAEAPFYLAKGDECEVFAAAHANGLPLLLKLTPLQAALGKGDV